MKNSIVHFEIPADDVERARAFYQDVFGWIIQPYEMPADGPTDGEPYYLVETVEVDAQQMPVIPGAINGGLMKRQQPDQPFMNYVNVDSIDAMLETIEASGGSVLMPKTEIAPGMGCIALFRDTENNVMGLHQHDK